jgi:acetylserotonin N-methyltransferase
VDLGGATGHLAIAACQRYPALNAVVFDLPQVIPLAREIVAASPVSRQIEFVEGNFFTDAIPQADLYSLGRILHDWSEEKIYKLLTLIYDRLPVGGGLLIAEKLLWEDKSGPSTGQLQDLNMLSCTEGRERSLREYESVLARVGFRDVVGCRTSAPVDAVLALK